MIFLNISCKPRNIESDLIRNYSLEQSDDIVPAAERVRLYVPLLQGKRVALAVNHSSMVRNRHLLDTMLSLDVQVVVLFSPEHGLRGTADAGATIANSQDRQTGLPIISLYGTKKKPTADDLKNVDVVVFDIQDVGTRFFTYISTLHYLMDACAEFDKEIIVLDRPNPNGHYVDGPVLDTAYRSFVGMHPVPIVYGLTIGEYANMINGEKWLTNHRTAKLTVIPCAGYTHNSMYKPHVKPSPNLPDIKSILVYPSTCLFEGTVVNEGRGTDKPFQIFGHPAYKKDGFKYTPMKRPGAASPKLLGVECYGTDLSAFSENDLWRWRKINLDYLIDYYQVIKPQETVFFNKATFDRLAGSSLLREQIEKGMTAEQIRATWQTGLLAYKKIRSKYLLYPDFQ